MTVASIQLKPVHLDQIKVAGEEAYPMEACGLIAGRLIDGDVLAVTSIVEATNILAAKTTDRFEVDPATRINLEKEVRGTNEQLIGHYHSHPDNSSLPSKTALENAHEPDLIWMIVSVKAGKALNVTAHRVLDDRSGFREINILIQTSS